MFEMAPILERSKQQTLVNHVCVILLNICHTTFCTWQRKLLHKAAEKIPLFMPFSHETVSLLTQFNSIVFIHQQITTTVAQRCFIL